MHFAVIGSGVVGLTTALELQKQFPNSNVTIVAEKFGVETTSDVAAGIFRPGTNFSGPTEEITRYLHAHEHVLYKNIIISLNLNALTYTKSICITQ